MGATAVNQATTELVEAFISNRTGIEDLVNLDAPTYRLLCGALRRSKMSRDEMIDFAYWLSDQLIKPDFSKEQLRDVHMFRLAVAYALELKDRIAWQTEVISFYGWDHMMQAAVHGRFLLK